MYCDIILIQHALTQWNLDGRTQGHTDTPLNETGKKMAKLLANRLEFENIDIIYSSDLQRAYKTIEFTSKKRNIPVKLDCQLREGRWLISEKDSKYDILPFAVESETEQDVQKRIIEVLTGIAETNLGKRVLVVSHGGAISLFIDYVRQNCVEKFPGYKKIRTAINIFRYKDGKWECILINDDRHLNNLKK